MLNKLDKINQIVDFQKARKENNFICDKSLNVKFEHDEKFEFVGLKEKLKKFPIFYRFLIIIISSVYVTTKFRDKLIKYFLNKNGIILNIASGNYQINKEIINVDLFAYPNVDIVSDATNLCLKRDSVDLIVNESSLEHIYNYKVVISESFRVLKKDGNAYFTVPFIYEFHASPNDFHRFTKEDLRKLFEEFGFAVEDIGILAGPASSFLGITTNFLAILLSFGFESLYQFWILFFMLLLWPIKFLDFFLNKIKFSSNIAAIFYVIAKKV
ncbi:MAG: Methyltransferase type 11 [candidate division TM6 bacterium GW2011_GWE2_31_21]|nr:MAG: Methyltransferase type 11 [candidate division TM6 bacterium GW2011_GWE2_31_21]KKP53906.1 MAG: Methyltransferase type 11 [candidate division TM6 bacterium GW2011_GWF2_33_332]